MIRINLEGLPAEARAGARAQIQAQRDLIEDGSSDLRIWLMQPGVEQPGEPANVRPIAQPVWVAARGDWVVCRPRAPSENTLLIRDLQRLARYTGMRDLANPAASVDLQSGVRVVVVDADGQPVAAGAPLMDGARCDYEVHNDSTLPVWVTLLELGADRSVTSMFPWEPGPGERIAPGAKFALAGDFLERHPDFTSTFSVGVPTDHPWVVQPGPVPETPPACVQTLKAIVTTAPVPLSVDGDLAELRATLEADAGDWVCVHHDQIIEPAPAQPAQVQVVDGGREISPTGSGYVLVYWAEKLSGASLGGCLGVTATSGMSQMGENWGYWNFPVSGAGWPSEFRLRPGSPGKSTVDGSGLPESQAINQFTGAVRRTNKPFSTARKKITLSPSQVDQSWKVTSPSGVVAYMARVGADLYWFTSADIAYMPKDILEFKSEPLPTNGEFYSAVDYLDG